MKRTILLSWCVSRTLQKFMNTASIVKFKVEFVSRDVPDDDRISRLSDWCVRFNQRGLTPKSQETGCSLGNLSFRLDAGSPAFVITASMLKSKEKPVPGGFVKVVESDSEQKIVFAEGTRDPSSESMMHYEIYKRREDVGAIFHGHDGEITAHASLLGLPETEKEEPPGTLELLGEVMKVLHNENFLVMKNHGFLSLGKTLDEAGDLALRIKKEIT